MTKLYQSKRKPETMLECIWKNPFKRIPFYYIVPYGPIRTLDLRAGIKYRTLFSNVHEAIFDYESKHRTEGFAAKYHIYTLETFKEPTKFIMKNTNPNDELSFSCEMLQPVTLEYLKTVYVGQFVEKGKELLDLNIAFDDMPGSYRYSHIQQVVPRWRMWFMQENKLPSSQRTEFPLKDILSPTKIINTVYGDIEVANGLNVTCLQQEVELRRKMKKLEKAQKLKKDMNVEYGHAINNVTKHTCAMAEIKFRKTMKKLIVKGE